MKNASFKYHQETGLYPDSTADLGQAIASDEYIEWLEAKYDELESLKGMIQVLKDIKI